MLWTMDIMQKIHKSVPGSPYVEFRVGDYANLLSIKLYWILKYKTFKHCEMVDRHTLKSLRDMNWFVDNLIEHFTEVYNTKVINAGETK